MIYGAFQSLEAEQVISFPVVTEWKVEIPAFGAATGKPYVFTLTPKPTTVITKAVAYFKVNHPGIGILKGDAWLYINGQEVAHFPWVGVGGVQEVSQDVSNIIHTGSNEVTWKVQDISASTFTVTARIDIHYTGETPTGNVTPTAEWPWWWWLAALGAGVGVIGIVGVVAYQEQQRFQMMMLMLARRREKE